MLHDAGHHANVCQELKAKIKQKYEMQDLRLISVHTKEVFIYIPSVTMRHSIHSASISKLFAHTKSVHALCLD